MWLGSMQHMDSLVEALDRGEPVDLGSLPPPPGEFSGMLPLSLGGVVTFSALNALCYWNTATLTNWQ